MDERGVGGGIPPPCTPLSPLPPPRDCIAHEEEEDKKGMCSTTIDPGRDMCPPNGSPSEEI